MVKFKNSLLHIMDWNAVRAPWIALILPIEDNRLQSYD